ncbi:MAG: hypothetical protein GTN53_18285 [Candidatus Aminicenantes bacterium]|nr:hypothetical protein [Candidatus Aminicenantes bacterium]NIT24446.1 hypothetical protein [Candidatus Aminicenantes bacterium]
MRNQIQIRKVGNNGNFWIANYYNEDDANRAFEWHWKREKEFNMDAHRFVMVNMENGEVIADYKRAKRN